MDTVTLAKRRYTTKAYDASRRIPQATIDTLLEQLRHSPSSVNTQPWHFIVADSAEGKARIAKSTEAFAYNTAKIRDASHVLVFAARTEMPEAHLQALLEQEARDGRFHTEQAKAGQDLTRRSYVDLHRFDQKDLQHWMEKQTYLALGTALLGAAALELDATPIEGFDSKLLDAELGLRERGFTSVVLLSLGYRSADDFNAGLGKSRLPASSVFTFL
ncbi:oxygen-insensitive NAD(P)H nitroreductase [Pseudomonas shirazensis]|uniref:Oxygen-insensitive NAD(P)H nitroreductase n=2 Tax=Pseudomonas TaxID=286 RepID=A0A5E6PGU1_PSEFL|nr:MULTISPECIES: oxygen-insensitive NAD(P)H nitroreductase [Pseudomonas]AUF96622.1 oxygen-insensitive NAD(P)H nitroreductase [Pseudomonas sp. 02C 26]MBA1198715.1 oxygen-insensitive NAD(P)H nitroreductase [Pseudomonas plecoglossicida]MBV4500189.1 oxygen-insensitive NAD(P)H nitroreductase [Pseudomonas shirazensis]QYX54250.1 oxygen-insensitive NAD(P)H nitroreductase [Pseudomonas sp. S07E 245]RZI89489.1 MAG: oxygen-insensitive NAD(P)H nitroreductase [Pseudomonas sp.]